MSVSETEMGMFPMTDQKPRMFYFGPWGEPGHHFFDEHGMWAHKEEDAIPWGHSIDGCLQPGCKRGENGHWDHYGDPETEGMALLHHKDGWTALSFWDRSVDNRFASNSNYFAEGIFTFGQMVEMAKTRFASRWNVMKFEVVPYNPTEQKS